MVVGERTQSNAKFALDIPDPLAQHRADAKLAEPFSAACAESASKPGAVFLRQRKPLPDKLLDRRGHSKVIIQQQFQRGGIAWMTNKQTRVIDE